MPNLQQPYEHEPVPRVPVIIATTIVRQPVNPPPITYIQANNLGELVATLQRLVAENPLLANADWFGYDDMCLRFDGYLIEPDLS